MYRVIAMSLAHLKFTMIHRSGQKKLPHNRTRPLYPADVEAEADLNFFYENVSLKSPAGEVMIEI